MDAKMALRRIHFGIADRGAREVVDADLSDCQPLRPAQE